MLRRFRVAVIIAPLLATLLHPLPVAANTAVTVDCGDGAPIAGSIDLNTLSELEGSIQGMVDNPSGMSCSLSQLTALDPLANSNDPGSFVVGGGRFFLGFGTECVVNFGLSAHVDGNGVPHGIQNYTRSDSPDNQVCGGQGHLKANVTCVAVDGNRAEIRGDIVEQTGSLSGFPPDTVVVTDVQDNGKPNTGVDDEISVIEGAPGSETNCVAPPPGTQFQFPVDPGNVTVHQGA